MSTEPVPSLAELTVIVHSLWATRYLSAAGIVILIYDHILTLKDELRLLWKTPGWSLNKLALLHNRYVVEVALGLAAYVQAGFASNLDQQRCRGFLVSIFVVAVVSMAFSNFVMVLQLYSLWDRNRRAMIVLFTAFGICYTCTVVCAGLTISETFNHARYYDLPSLHICGISQTPKFLPGVWVGMSAFDIFILILALGNGLDRPHRQHVGVLNALYRDGASFFMALLMLRVTNLILSVVTKETSQTFIVSFFAWPMACVVLSRLILRIEDLKSSRKSLQVWDAPSLAPGLIEMKTRVEKDLL